MAYRPSLIFCVNETGTNGTDHLFERLSALADVTQSNGGIASLIDMLRHRSHEPDFLFLELDGEPTDIFGELDTLKDYVTSATSVYGFGRINDVRFLRSLLAIGFKDYFIPPFEDEIFNAIVRVVAAGHSGTHQPVVGFVSLAGGVGTSLVALNFSRFLADHTMSGVALFHPQPMPYNTQFDHYDFNISAKSDGAHPILIKQADAQSDEQDRDTDKEFSLNTIDRYRENGNIIVIDIGTHLSDHTNLARCDHFIIIGEPDYRSLLTAKSMDVFLSSRFPFAERHHALNKIDRDGRIEFIRSDIQGLIHDEPIMLYRFDSEKMDEALAKSVPLLPQSLLKDRQAFEKLCTRCRIPLKRPAIEELDKPNSLASLRALLSKWKMTNG